MLGPELRLNRIAILPARASQGDVAAKIHPRPAVNLQLFERPVELLLAQLRGCPQILDRLRLLAERLEDLLQMADRWIVAVEKKVVGSLVGVAVHQVGPAGSAVAARAANLLVVAFEGRGQPGVDHRANIGLVDAHSKGDGGHYHFQFTGLKGGLHPLPRLCLQSGVISRSGDPAPLRNRQGEFLGQPLGIFSGGGVHNRRPPGGIGQKTRNRGGPRRHRQLHYLDSQIVAPEAVNELCRVHHPQLGHNVGLHRGGRRSRQRHHRRRVIARPQLRQVLAQHPVVGAKVVPPLRDAVRFVNGDERQFALGQHLRETRHPQPLRRNE